MTFNWLRKIFGRKRKRQIDQDPNSNPSTSMKVLSKMFQELECPICFNTCTPPILTCENGHIICKECRKSVARCPSCRKGFNGTRNLFAENFISNYSQPCRFKQEGCDFLRWKGENMKPHEDNCMFRPVNCIICGIGLPYKSLLPHLTSIHKIDGTDKLPLFISYHFEKPLIVNRKWLPYCIQAFGNNFYVMFEVERPNFWIWVWQQTNKAESSSAAGSYVASLIFDNIEQGLSLRWIGPVHSIRTSEALIKKDGLCFVSPEVSMQHFKVDDKLSVSIHIEKQILKPVGSEYSANSGLSEIASRHYRSASNSRVDINGNFLATPVVSSVIASDLDFSKSDTITDEKIEMGTDINGNFYFMNK